MRVLSQDIKCFVAPQKNTFVETIYLVNNDLGDDGVLCFAQSISKKLPLGHLRICSNGMTRLGGSSMLKACSGFDDLRILDVAENKLADETMDYVAQMLNRTPALVQLGLRGNSIGNKGYHPILRSSGRVGY